MRRLTTLVVAVTCLCALAGSTASAAGEEIVVEMGGNLQPNQPHFWIDPGASYSVQGWQVGYVTCLKLLYYDEVTGVLSPDAATSMPTVSADRKTYTFTIASGHRFSDVGGEIVTAESFKRAIERATSPTMASTGNGAQARFFVPDIVGAQQFFSGAASEISGVDAVGNTLTIELLAPAEDFPHRIGMNFFCATSGTAPSAFSVAPLASAGPYFVSASSASEVVLQRNPNYGGTRLRNLGTIRIVPFGTPGAEDYVAGPPATFVAPPATTEALDLSTIVFHLPLNTSRPPFDRLDTRRAAAYAVDRTAISATRGWQPTDQFVSPLIPGAQDAAIYPLTSDVATAQALLAGAPDPTPAVRLCHAVSPNHTALATGAKPHLEAAGFVVTLVAVSPPGFFDHINNPNNCELTTAGWLPDYQDPAHVLTPFFHSDNLPPSGSNYSFFQDPGFDARLDAALTMTPEAARLAEYADLDADFAAAAPSIAVGFVRQRSVFSSRMGCLSFNQGIVAYALNRLCIEVSENASAGGTVSTGDEATPASPLQTSVTVPSGGDVTITQGQSTSAVPPEYRMLEQRLDISAPAQTPPAFLTLAFELDASLLAGPPPLAIDDVAVYRDGSPIPNCTGAGATPDPCVASRTAQGDGDGEIVVRSSQASIWEFGELYDPADAATELAAIVAQATPVGDKAGDALGKVDSAIAKLAQTPPDRQGALGELEGAVGDLEAAVKDGLLASGDAGPLLVELAGAARLVALAAHQEAIDRGGNAGKIAEAAQAIADGDATWASDRFKDAVAKYKDAVSKAEGA